MGQWKLVLAFVSIYSLMKSLGGDAFTDIYKEMYNAETVRLPTTLRPSTYNITLFFPNVTDGPTETGHIWLSCKTMIYITCYEDTDEIRLHTKRHTIKNITIQSLNDGEYTNETQLNSSSTSINYAMETMNITPGFTLRNGSSYLLTLSTESTFTDRMHGLYYSSYEENGKTRYLITTIFEPTDARLLFPCFDEPFFKAVYLLNIIREEGITCISNLPRRTTIEPTTDVYYTDVFDEPRNVPMSTYLVAFTCGDIDYLNSSVDGIQLRTYSRRSLVNQTQYSLDIGIKTMKYFQEYFEIPYPLPKEDMVAVPDMPFDAMEHWGMITYREQSMLFEEGVSTEELREYIVILVAHEISHQWFGNLVSPNWWDDLWLNEGFATYMMFLGADKIIPEMKMMNKLIVDYRGIHIALKADDSLSSHPVYVPVYHPDQINMIFDLISYAKGCAVIRMMHFFLGDDTFRNGLVRYLTDFSYKTATHNDLWATLEKQALDDNITTTNVKYIMDTWLLEKNYPIIMATKEDNDTLMLSQTVFLMSENERKERQNIFWEVPFTYTTDQEHNFEKSPEDITWLHKDGHNVTIVDNDLANASWYLGNILQYGFYRVNYPRDNWLALIVQLKNNPFAIHPINRAQLIDDIWNIARANLLNLSLALECMEYLDKETDYVPWRAAIQELEYVRNSLQLTPIYGLFEKFMKKKLQSVYQATKGANTSYDILQHSMITKEACYYGLEECVDDVLLIFDQWRTNTSIRVDPNIKETVYCIGVQKGGSSAWEHVIKMYIVVKSSGEKASLLNALTCTREPWILAKFLDTTVLGNMFSLTQKFKILKQIAVNPVGRLLTLGFLEDKWESISKKYSSIDILADIIETLATPYNTPHETKRVEQFIANIPKLKPMSWKLDAVVAKSRENMDSLNKYWTLFETWLSNQ